MQIIEQIGLFFQLYSFDILKNNNNNRRWEMANIETKVKENMFVLPLIWRSVQADW